MVVWRLCCKGGTDILGVLPDWGNASDKGA